MYLIFTRTNGIKEVETLEEVKTTLKIETFVWTQDDSYSGLSWEDLFNYCWTHKCFGDIAQVYKIEPYFLVNETKIPCGFYEADYNKSFDCMKIM